MCSEQLAIDLAGVSKRYEIYAAPQDRLKQMVMPPLHKALHATGAALGLVAGAARERRFFTEFWALKDVSLKVRRGETLGIIGRNGSGKSTLLQIIAGTMAPTSGTVTTHGRIAALLELGSGFNPDFTGRENVFLNSAILGMSREETERRFDAIVAFADIGEFLDQPMKTYSSGMFVRLAFAVQAHIDASVVLIDEALAVGDVFFRQKCYVRLEELRASGAAIVLVSHSMPDVEQFCERAILLDHGNVLFQGAASEASKHYYLAHQKETIDMEGPSTALRHAPDAALPSAPGWRPDSSAYLDISIKPQVDNGWAKCIGVALVDAHGVPRNAFRQGDVAIFHYEFEILRDIGAAIGGVVLRSEKGVIAHGKNSLQFDHLAAAIPPSGSIVMFSQEIVLDIAVGEYVFEVGLAGVAPTDWDNRGRISHGEMSGRHVRICHLPDVGSFSISLALRDGVPILVHHGVANLPGNMRVQILASATQLEADGTSLTDEVAR